MKKKTGRNDPCPCGSGKKFKKCCESIMIAGRYKAAKINTESSSQIKKTVNMTSLFQTQLAATPKKPTEVDAAAQSVLMNKVSSQKEAVKSTEISVTEQISSQ